MKFFQCFIFALFLFSDFYYGFSDVGTAQLTSSVPSAFITSIDSSPAIAGAEGIVKENQLLANNVQIVVYAGEV